ncbi:MAG: type II toxin-antitoxin system VapC family toxin [bacterium]
MSYLLDTAVFLWMIFGEEEKFSRKALKIVEESDNLYLSAASLWEIAIKFSLGKLSLQKNPDTWLPDVIGQMNLKPLPITQGHALAVAQLPYHHKDPFDRLLIGQARREEMSILSPDRVFKKYKIPLVW